MKKLLLVLAILGSGAALHAAPLERDLGRGLVYHRAVDLPGDLPATAPADKRAHVLDLRYAHGDSAAAAALEAWLKFHATPHTPVFILANAKTSSVLLAPLAGHDPVQGILVFGAEAPGFLPDIGVKISGEADLRAYDALAAGGNIAALLTDNPDKPRNDEAKLNQDHLPGAAAASDPQTDESFPEPEKTVPAKTPPPIVDLVLQRAVHLHRTLLALKKL